MNIFIFSDYTSFIRSLPIDMSCPFVASMSRLNSKRLALVNWLLEFMSLNSVSHILTVNPQTCILRLNVN